jgi:hypothetical protein
MKHKKKELKGTTENHGKKFFYTLLRKKKKQKREIYKPEVGSLKIIIINKCLERMILNKKIGMK